MTRLEETEAARLRAQLSQDGPEATSERYGVGVVTLLRASVPLDVHYATAVAIRAYLPQGGC